MGSVYYSCHVQRLKFQIRTTTRSIFKIEMKLQNPKVKISFRIKRSNQKIYTNFKNNFMYINLIKEKFLI